MMTIYGMGAISTSMNHEVTQVTGLCYLFTLNTTVRVQYIHVIYMYMNLALFYPHDLTINSSARSCIL